MGADCEAPHLRSISAISSHEFCTLVIFHASASTVLQGGLASWYPRLLSSVEEPLFLRG